MAQAIQELTFVEAMREKGYPLDTAKKVQNLLRCGRPVPMEHIHTGTKRKATNQKQVLSNLDTGYGLDI